MKKIIKNAVKCKKCGEIIESKTVHDLVSCKCGCCAVDGGKQYIRRMFDKSPNDYIELSKFEDIKVEAPKDKIQKDSLCH